MAKKKPEYDVTERFKRVAELAAQKPSKPETSSFTAKAYDNTADTRPGASMSIQRDKYGKKKDVNLPFVKGPRK